MTLTAAELDTATPQSHARERKLIETARLARIGHKMAWRKGHGLRWLKQDPGYRGVCIRCGGIARVAWLTEGTGYSGYEGAMRNGGFSPAKCDEGKR